ncbi:hypothetical protein [Pseudalkalibacillus caeni]|uniref:Cytosolic protein n=1 Tax=Exobacillus caeni TaxID=2574798 RepID=A0A5R9EZS8_9BACL|nr:hypothetical protein [Pseudalkalibacillus caeni]TLS35706.1 hypothetical protein FCL54_18790 [Pseudalkalibacillus caeni]
MAFERDITELTMIPKNEWQDQELAFYHSNLKQMAAYLNSEGVSMHHEIIKEIENRGGMKKLNQ